MLSDMLLTFPTKGFERLVQCSCQQSVLPLSSLSPLRHEHVDDTLDSVNEVIDFPITVELICSNHTTRLFDLPSVQTTFEELCGKVRKTEKANPPLSLIGLVVAAVWATFRDDHQHVIIPPKTLILTLKISGSKNGNPGASEKKSGRDTVVL